MSNIKKKRIDKISQNLYKTNGFQVMELEESTGLLSNWALLGEGSYGKRFVLFSDLQTISKLNIEAVERVLQQKFNLDLSEITIVYILLEENGAAEKNRELLSKLYEGGKKEIAVITYALPAISIYYGETDTFAYLLASILQEIQEGEGEKSPLITYGLIAVNILVYAFTAYLTYSLQKALAGGQLDIWSTLNSLWDADNRVLVYMGSKFNPLIASGQYYRFITCMFLHGGVIHLLFNMYSLYAVGPLIERVYGKLRFSIIYLVSGITASFFSYLFSNGNSVGASGAIFGLLGGTLFFALRMRRHIGKGFAMNILSVIFINVMFGISIPNIDNFAHLGGLIGGFIVTAMLAILKEKKAYR